MPLTLEELKKKTLSLEELIKPKALSLEELTATPELELTPEEQALRLENLQKSVTDYMEDPEAGYIRHPGEKIARRTIEGFFEEATLGTAKKPGIRPKAWAKPGEEPETWYEGIAKGAGQFTGFFATPLPLAKFGLKLLGKGARFILGKGGQKVLEKTPSVVKRVAGYAARAPLEIGTASAISDVTEMGEAPQRFAQGATWGAIFSAAGLTHVTKSKLINQILSQGGGRALMAVAGQYPPESLTTENLPNLIFQEAISTYFLRYGMSPKALLTGKLNAKQKKIRKNVDDAIFEANKEAELTGGAKLPTTTEVASNRLGTEKLPSHKMEGKLKEGWKKTKRGKNVGDFFYKGFYIRLEEGPDKKIWYSVSTPSGKHFDGKFGKYFTWEKRAEALDIVKKHDIEEGGWLGEELELRIEQAQKISFVDTFAYDTKTKNLKPRMGEAAKDPPGEHEILFRRNPDTGEITFRDRGKGTAKLTGKGVKIELKAAEKQLAGWDKSPFGRIDSSMKLKLQEELVKMGSNIEDFPTFLRGLGINHTTANVTEWLEAQEILSLMKKVPQKDRMDIYNIAIGLKEDRPIISKQIAEFQAKDDVLWKKEWIKQLKWAKKKGEPDDKFPLAKILGKTTKGRDVRYALGDWELQTGIPFYELYLEAAGGKNKAVYQTKKDYAPIDALGGVRKRDGRKLQDYWFIKSRIKEADLTPEQRKILDLTPRQREIADVVDRVFAERALGIRLFRTKIWIEARKKGLPTGNEEFKKQPELLPVLEEALKIYDKGGDSALRAFLADKDFGTIEAGSYFPEKTLGGKFSSEYEAEWSQSFDFLTKSPMEIRESGIDTNLRTFHTLQAKAPFLQRIHSYLRTINNLEYMTEPLKKWQKLWDTYGHILESTAAPGQFKAKTRADDLKLYMYRLKGYPVKHSRFPTRLIMWIRKWFFTAFPLKPHAWARNWMQPKVLSPRKEIVFDPKWLIREAKREARPDAIFRKYKNLPLYAKEYFESDVMQFDPIKYDYFFLDQQPRGAEMVPGIGAFVRLARRVGTIYAKFDTLNRKANFIPMFRATEHYLDKFRIGEIDWKTVESRLSLDKIEPYERKHFRWLVSEGRYEEAQNYNAGIEATNTNFKYDRSEKAFFEMTEIGEASTNILTWSKGVMQLTYNATKKIHEGTNNGDFKAIKKWNWKKIALGTDVLLTMIMAGRLVNKAYENLTVSHFRKYSDYQFPETMMWEFGGVDIGILKDLSDVIFSTYRALAGESPVQKKRAMLELAGFIDNVTIRQMLPFANNALALTESLFGYSYIAPIRNLFIRKAKKVERTFLERITHAFFAKDPNKSADVYREIKRLRSEWYSKAMGEKNPAKRWTYMGYYEFYDYHAKLLKRYQPK